MDESSAMVEFWADERASCFVPPNCWRNHRLVERNHQGQSSIVHKLQNYDYGWTNEAVAVRHGERVRGEKRWGPREIGCWGEGFGRENGWFRHVGSTNIGVLLMNWVESTIGWILALAACKGGMWRLPWIWADPTWLLPHSARDNEAIDVMWRVLLWEDQPHKHKKETIVQPPRRYRHPQELTFPVFVRALNGVATG